MELHRTRLHTSIFTSLSTVSANWTPQIEPGVHTVPEGHATATLLKTLPHTG